MFLDIQTFQDPPSCQVSLVGSFNQTLLHYLQHDNNVGSALDGAYTCSWFW